MYGIINDRGNIIALHDELKVIEKFVEEQNLEYDNIIKFKKKKAKQIRENVIYQDLYLVRIGNKYVPYELYDTMKGCTDEYKFDLEYCKDVLFRLLEDGNRGKHDLEAIRRVIEIVSNELLVSNSIDISTLRSIKDLNSRYENEVNENE